MTRKCLEFLKYLSIFAYQLMFYPFLSFSISAVGKFDVALSLQLLAGLIGTSVIAILFSLLTHKVIKFKSVVLYNIVRVIVDLITATGFVFYANYLTNNIILAIVMSLVCVVSFLLTSKLYFLEYTQVLTQHTLQMILVINFGHILACFFAQFKYDIATVAFLSLIFFIVFFIQQNQASIDLLMERRHHKSTNLPANIRKFNLLVSSIIAFILIVAFLFRNYLTQAIWAVLGFLQDVIGQILDALYKETEKYESNIGGLQGVAGGNITGGDEAQTNPVMDVVYNIILWAIFLAFMFLIFKSFYKGIIETYRKIKLKIYTFFHQNEKKKIKEVESDYYTDFEETLSEEEKAAYIRQQAPKEYTKFMWLREYSKFKTITSDSDKVTYGYNLIVKWLKLNKVEIEKSDTPNEIMEKYNGLDSAKKIDIDTATNIFNVVYYGEKDITNHFIENMTATIDKLKRS